MILLSLENSEDIISCGGGKWGHDRTHPGEQLQTTDR
jgi:hypothetical protein